MLNQLNALQRVALWIDKAHSECADPDVAEHLEYAGASLAKALHELRMAMLALEDVGE